MDYSSVICFFFFNDTATTEIYTLSLHDALPIFTDIAAKAKHPGNVVGMHFFNPVDRMPLVEVIRGERTSDAALVTVDRKSTRLNSSHANISYAVFCLKKKKKNIKS